MHALLLSPDPNGGPALFFSIASALTLILITIISGQGTRKPLAVSEGLKKGLAAGVMALFITIIILAPLQVRWQPFALFLIGISGLAGALFTKILETRNLWRAGITGCCFGVSLWAITLYFILPLMAPSVFGEPYFPFWLFIFSLMVGLLLTALITTSKHYVSFLTVSRFVMKKSRLLLWPQHNRQLQ